MYIFLFSTSCEHIYRTRNSRPGSGSINYPFGNIYATLVLYNVAGLMTNAFYDFDMIAYRRDEVRGMKGCKGPYEPIPEA